MRAVIPLLFGVSIAAFASISARGALIEKGADVNHTANNGATALNPPKAGEHNCQVMLWLGMRVPQTCRICVKSVCITCMQRLFKMCVSQTSE